MGTRRDLRRGPGRGERRPEGSARRRNDPGPRRPRLRQVADPPGPRRRIPADDGPDCHRRGPQPIRRAGGAPEAGRRRRGALLERSPCADPGAEAISHAGAVTDHAQRGRTQLGLVHDARMEKKPPYVLPRPYAHLLLELDDERLGDLRGAISGVAGCTLVGARYPPLEDPARVAEGWVESVAEAHPIDIEVDDYAAYNAAI